MMGNRATAIVVHDNQQTHASLHVGKPVYNCVFVHKSEVMGSIGVMNSLVAGVHCSQLFQGGLTAIDLLQPW